MYALDDDSYQYISRSVYDYAKINLTEKKRSLIISRLSKRIRKLDLSGFKEYIDYLENKDPDNREFLQMVDSLSTNYSHFFRESHHLDFLTSRILPETGTNTLNIWSAASSTGQEIYSILITLLEYQEQEKKKINFSLYASDISIEALSAASKGLFPRKDGEYVDEKILKKYFLSGSGSRADYIKMKNELVRKIKFFRLNLNDESYRLPVMDIIFLRNVIIYFDKETKIRLINKLYNYLKPGGYLFLGHSESLSGISSKFRICGKTIYQRIEA